MKRQIIKIDESKCNGCGDCVTSCAEGAIKIINGKAKLISDQYCDGLGACLGHCPMDALEIIEREADAFDEELVNQHIEESKPQPKACNCPGKQARNFAKSSGVKNWPLQMCLVPEQADFYHNADLLISADCVSSTYINFHNELVRDKTLLIGCPKLDDAQFYIEKLARIFAQNDINSITIARMEVPCCRGLAHIVKQALEQSGKDISLAETVIAVTGEVLSV